MNKFKVVVQHYVLYQADVLIEAETEEEAQDIAREQYYNEEIELLPSDDYITKDENISVYEADEYFIKANEE